MRKRVSIFPYIFLCMALFFTLNLPKKVALTLRSIAVSSFLPSWKAIQIGRKELSSSEKEKKGLELENEQLQRQLAAVKKWLTFDGKIKEQVDLLDTLQALEENSEGFFVKKSAHLSKLLHLELLALPANVIFRQPSSWGSSLWIDVGEKDNEALEKPIISKNSPVVVGTSLVGVVEYVGAKKSRVRLITDSGLITSVRCSRGKTQNQELFSELRSVYERLLHRDDLFVSSHEKDLFLSFLASLQDKTTGGDKDLFLAKGEISGASAPLWRSQTPILKGMGFNYRYADEQGPARDLITGSPIGEIASIDRLSLLQKGDLLITTGMDGVFPAGLHVGIISKVFPLQQGSYYYEIEAKPTAGNLYDLSYVFVLPSNEFLERSSP